MPTKQRTRTTPRIPATPQPIDATTAHPRELGLMPRKKKPEAPPAAPVAEIETPPWANEIPEEFEYTLQVMDWATGLGDPLQRIEMTREEYSFLKDELARRRGYGLNPTEAHLAGLELNRSSKGGKA